MTKKYYQHSIWEKKKKRCINLSEKAYHALVKKAEEEGRTLSGYLEKIGNEIAKGEIKWLKLKTAFMT